MKRSFCQILTLATMSLTTGTLCWGQQPGTAATPSIPETRPIEARAPRESKEKAEDAELMRQLEAESQQLDVESQQARGEKSRADRARGRGGMALAAPGMPDTFSFNGKNILTRPSAGPRALVIRTGDADPKGQSTLEEDLAVMSHLLDKALEDVPGAQGNGNRVMGIDVFFSPGSSPVRSLYLDNYGAVFFVKVHFPLLLPGEKRSEEKINPDSAWEEARQELYGQRQGNGPGEPAEEFSQEKVDKLKETLIETLKNGSNIRGLKPDDWVTICVSGGSSSGGRRRVKTSPTGAVGGNITITTASEGAGSRSFLTLRARKSDIDRFAKGQLNPADFQKQCKLTAYGADSPSLGIETTVISNSHARAK